jgi:hypothetical protein
MSIEIVGSNDKKIKLITKNNIESIIDNQEIVFNLYKTKYFNNCQSNNSIIIKKINKSDYSHLIKQLIKTFYKYDNNKDLNYNLKQFVYHLNFLNKNNNITIFINNFLIQHHILDKLELAIKKNLIKSFKKLKNKEIEDIQLNKNFLLDILHTINIISKVNKNNNSSEINELLEKIKNNLDELNKLIDNMKIIKIKSGNIIKYIPLNKNEISCKFISNIIENLDLFLKNTKLIKTNILKIDSIINIITELLYKLYLLI